MLMSGTSKASERFPLVPAKLPGTPGWLSENGFTVIVIVAPVLIDVTVQVCSAPSRLTTPAFVRKPLPCRRPRAYAVTLSAESNSATEGKLCDTVPVDPGCGVQMR